MKLFMFSWGLVYVYVIAESREKALEKIRSEYSVARRDYTKYCFSNDPDEEEVSIEGMITHFGCE